MTTATSTRMMTGKVRLSFVNLFNLNKDGKYSTTILVPKSDVTTKANIDAAVNAAIEYGVKSKWKGVRPPKINIPIHDGDGVKPSDGLPFGPECKGHWVFTASAYPEYKPGVVDQMVQPILNQSEMYSGVYAKVSVNFFPYENSGKKGIGVGLGNVQKVADGESLAGGKRAEEEFTPVQLDPITGQPM